MWRKQLLAVALSLSSAGMVHAGLLSDDEAHRKIEDLKKENAQTMQAVETRLAKLEGMVNNQGLVELLNQIEALKADFNKLRGQVEVHTHELEVTQKRQKDLYADLDMRLRNLEKPGSAAPALAPVPDAAVQGKPGAQPVSSADTSAEGRAYEAALNLFKVGNYQGAIAAFQNFLKTYPTSGNAPSAQYWIGNSHFALRDYRAAMDAQRKLLATYPNSQKVPDAMLNIASCQTELGETKGARKTLEDLVAKFPVSEAAERAQKRLANTK